MSALNLFVSSPFFNEPQAKVSVDIAKLGADAGFNTFGPMDHEFGDQWHEKRMEDLKKSHLAVVWLDSLLEPGQAIFRLKDVRRENLMVPLPEELVNLISIGMQATGKAQMKPKSGLVLPGEPQQGMEVTNVPTGFKITAPGGVFGQAVNAGALNIPEPTVMFELGMLIAENVPVIALSLAYPAAGPYKRMVDMIVTELDLMPSALKEANKVLNKITDTGPLLMDKVREAFEVIQESITKREEEIRSKTEEE